MNKVLNEIQTTINAFNKSIPKIQQQVFDEIVLLSKELETDGKNIKTSVKNLKLLARIKTKIEKIIYSKEYEAQLKDYLKAYNTIGRLQNEYFKEIDNKYKPTALTAEIKAQSVESTMQSLGRAGIANNVSDKIIDNIRNNITSGATFTQFNKSLRELVLDTDSGQGLLVRYTKQISTDAINQYAANYTQVAVADLGLEWYQYTGTLIETSRCFCEALVKKRYIHKSELPKIVLGKFKEFEDADCKINPKTNLPQGMIAGTTAANFPTYRGGYNCGHQLIAISKSSVPKELLAKFGEEKENKTTKEVKKQIIVNNLQEFKEIDLPKKANNTTELANEIYKYFDKKTDIVSSSKSQFGFEKDTEENDSLYFSTKEFDVRVSNHELPNRNYKALGGGKYRRDNVEIILQKDGTVKYKYNIGVGNKLRGVSEQHLQENIWSRDNAMFRLTQAAIKNDKTLFNNELKSIDKDKFKNFYKKDFGIVDDEIDLFDEIFRIYKGADFKTGKLNIEWD